MPTNLVDAVKAYALTHYEDGGWDVIVECYGDAEIAEVIGDATTLSAALASFSFVAVLADRQADARNSAF